MDARRLRDAGGDTGGDTTRVVDATQGAGGIAGAGRGYTGYIAGRARDASLRACAGCFADMARHCAGTAQAG